jgi:hypothetical protein
MRVSMSSSVIDVRIWRTQKEMMAYLERCKRHLVLGNRGKDEGAISLAYSSGLLSTNQPKLGVGIIAVDTGFEPQTIVLEEAGILLVGFEQELVAIDIAWAKIRFRIGFDTCFREMIYSEPVGILAFEDFGVSAISVEGEKRWTFTKDVLTNMKLDNQNLHLEFMDSPPVVVNVESGNVLTDSSRR